MFGRWRCPPGGPGHAKGRLGPAPPRRPPYLFATLSDGGRELTDYHIHTLDTGLFELLHLLFHCGFKSEVRCEEARPAPGEDEEEEDEGGTRGSGWVGAWVGSRRGTKAKRAVSGVGEDGTGVGEETPTRRKRTEDNVSVRPGPPCRHPGAGRPEGWNRAPVQRAKDPDWLQTLTAGLPNPPQLG